MLTARGTKWSASSLLYAYGSPCLTPQRRSTRASASTAASPIHASVRALSVARARRLGASHGRGAAGAALRTVGIDGVVAARVYAAVARLRDLVVGVVPDVDDRLEEDGGAEREHRDAPRPQAVGERVLVVFDVGARLA